MIVAVTGLGGSGKTTVLQRLREILPVEVVHYPDAEGILPVLRRASPWHRGRAHDHAYRDTPPRPGLLVLWVKAGLFLLDAWIVWFRHLRHRPGIVLCDRCPYDYLVYLHSVATSGRRFLAWLARLMPRVDGVVYVDVRPEIVRDRKPEWGLEYLRRQAEAYMAVLGQAPAVVYPFDGAKSPEALARGLADLLDLISQRSRLDAATLTLLGLLDPEVRTRRASLLAVLKPPKADVIRVARRNRLAYAIAQARGDGQTEFRDVSDRYGRWAQTVEWLNETCRRHSLRLMIIKSFLSSPVPRLPSDVDVIVPDTDRRRLAEILAEHGRLRQVEQQKWEWRAPDLLPVDLYVGGVHEAAMETVGEAWLWERAVSRDALYYPSGEAEILLVIAHSTHETAVITLFDLIQVKRLSDMQSIDWAAITREAARCGWKPLLDLWLTYLNGIYMAMLHRRIAPGWPVTPPYFGGFPIRLPLTWLLLTWGKWNWEKRVQGTMPAVGLVAHAARAARIWHVRRSGRIPFHDD